MAEYSWEQVAEHSSAESLWVVIRKNVYDVTEFQFKHPGKTTPLLYYAGKDATEGFEKVAKHAAKEGIEQYMKMFCIGTIKTEC